MKLHLPKGLRKAVMACLALSASYAAYAEEIRPNGLEGGYESEMSALKGYTSDWDGDHYTYYSGYVYLGIELTTEDTQGPDGVQIPVDCVGTDQLDTQVILTDATDMYPGSIAAHGTQWSRFGGYLAGYNISSELRSSSLVIRDIADSVSISGWNVGGSGQIYTGTHLSVTHTDNIPTFNNVGTTSVSIEATKGKDFYVFGVDGVTLQDNRNKMQEVYNGYTSMYDGSVSAGPISIVGGNLTNTVLQSTGGHSTQSVVSKSSNVSIAGGNITGHVIGGSAVISFRNDPSIPEYDPTIPDSSNYYQGGISKEQHEVASRFAHAHTAFELWVAETHVTMTGGKMEKGWAHGQNGSLVSNYYYYDESGAIQKDDEGNPYLKQGVNNTMVPRIVGGNLLHIADIGDNTFGKYYSSYDTYQPTSGWDDNVPAFGVGNTYVTISGDSEVYDVIGGSWSMIDIPDMVGTKIDRSEETTDAQFFETMLAGADGNLLRDVRQGNTHVTLRDQVVVKGDVIAAGIQSGRTALITESTRIALGANVVFQKDLTKYDPESDKKVPVTNMWEINGTHSIVDGGYMLIDPPMGGSFDLYDNGAFVPWLKYIPQPPPPVYSGKAPLSMLKYADMLEAEGIDWRDVNWDEEFDMSGIEKKGYWHLAGFEEGGFGWNDADYSVYSDHPYVHGERTLALDEAAEYHESLKDAYFINFDQVEVVKGAGATIGSLVIDDNQTFADDGSAPDSENWSSTLYDNDVPMEYRERNLTTISGGGEIRMHVGFDMEVWYWEAKDYEGSNEMPDDETLRDLPNGTVVGSNFGREKYLSAVYDPEVLNNTYIAVQGYADDVVTKAVRNEFGELAKSTTLHLLPRENTADTPVNSKGEASAVSYAYRMEAYNGGVLHVDVAPSTGRNTMYVLNELNIHDEGYLKMTVNLTSDMERQEFAAIHKAPKDTVGSAPGSVRELMTDWTTKQTVTFNNGYFDLRIKAADRSLYKDELYIVLIDRVTGNNVEVAGDRKNYTITERTKEVLDFWFGDDYDWEHSQTDTATWDQHHVWIGVEKVVDGRETDGLVGEELLEADRAADTDDWAMVIRAKKVAAPETPEEPEVPEEPEITYHKRRAHTPNGEAGGDLMDEFTNHPSEDPEDVRRQITERVIDLNSEGQYEQSDRLEAAVAGSSVSVLAGVVADDMERQLRNMRARASKNLGQELVRMRRRIEDGGKAGNIVHEYPEAIPSKRFGFWVNGEGSYARVQDRSTDPGYRQNAWGGTVGASYAVSDRVEAGLALTAMYGDLRTKGPDLLKADTDTYYLSAFARVDSGKWSHSFIGVVGLVNMDGARTVNIGGDYGSYTNDFDTDGYSLGLMYELGYTFAGNYDKTSLYQAVVNIAWRHVDLGGYTESGDTAATLRVGEQETDSLILGGGMRAQWLLSGDMMNRGSLLELRALAKGYVGSLRNRVPVGFADRSHTAGVRSRKQGGLGVELGAGYTLPLGSGAGDVDHSIFMDVSVEIRRACGDMNATVGYRIAF